METNADSLNLRTLITEQVPEARQAFMVLPKEASLYTMLDKFYDVTSQLAYQHKFKAVKRCLQVADNLLLTNEKRVSNAVCSTYVYRLAQLLDQRNDQADVLHFLLPRTLRAEYYRQLYACQA